MIKITIEFCPPLFTGKSKKVIAEAIIVNDGTGTEKRGNYRFTLWLKKRDFWHNGIIKNFPRKSYNIWELLKRVLNEI